MAHPGPLRAPQSWIQLYIVNNFLDLFECLGARGGPGGPRALTEGAFGNILKGVAYCFVLECDLRSLHYGYTPISSESQINLKSEPLPQAPGGP